MLRHFLTNTTHDVMIPLTVLRGPFATLRQRAAAGRPVERSSPRDARTPERRRACLDAAARPADAEMRRTPCAVAAVTHRSPNCRALFTQESVLKCEAIHGAEASHGRVRLSESSIMSALPRGAVTPLKGAAAAAIAWRTQGRHYVTVIAKASFAFAIDAVMWRTDPQEILPAEVHHGKNPARSIRWSGDLAPYLGRADVVFTGDAHAPRGTEVQSLPVRLAVYSAGGWVLDKRLLVRDKGPFRQIPLVYERAVGGANGWENPFDGEPMDGPASILDLQDPTRPAGFAPLARTSPMRRRLLGSTPRKALEGPNADIPAGFDWSYFQAAPADQRIPFLQGDEWIVLEHVNPAAPRLQMRLPGARGVARIQGLDASASAAADGELLELNADTLRIDGVEQRCTVVWRRVFPVSGEDALAAVRIVAGVEIEGEEIAWPDVRLDEQERMQPAHPPSLRLGSQATARIKVAPDGAGEAWLAPELPISLSAEDVEFVDSPPPLSAASLFQTLALPQELDEPSMRAPALPFGPAAPAPASQGEPGPVADQIPALFTSTTLLSREDEARATDQPATPFPAAPPLPPRVAPELPIPGAPWSGEPAARAHSASVEPATSATSAPTATAAAPACFEAPLDTTTTAVPGLVSEAFEQPAASHFFHELRRDRDAVPEPLPPLGEGAEVSLERCAIVAAELAERPVPRADVLRAHGLSDERWEQAEMRWQEAMAEEARRRERPLRDRFDAAYLAAWESIRGVLHPTDYARLVVATERDGAAAALDSLAIRRTVWAQMKRLWARRLAGDPRLRAHVEAEIATLRGAPRQPAESNAPAAQAG
ncbi:DUF2169 domain-containing protein [Sorangium sp. So ce381]|uniref:DUF2169 family type VI secretion system accessory protein n=1 Tax=Sorangium sp. So ce381 TaxID=3133307 RepID=UPI003F5AE028